MARSGVPSMANTAATDTPNAASIARQATPPETDFGNRLPRKALTRNPANGSSGISASTAIAILAASPLEAGERVGVQRFPVAEEGDDDRQANGGFGGGDGHHE